MIVAKEKRKNNLAEYILYMWQVEDLIRAHQFDFDQINEKYISMFKVDETTLSEIREWYKNLLLMMEKEHLQTPGKHLQFINNLINDLNEFHLKLLETRADPSYSGYYLQTQAIIAEFRQISKSDISNDVEICLNGLYSFMLLRLQKKEVSPSTAKSFQSFGQLIGHLSARYLQFEKGDFEF